MLQGSGPPHRLRWVLSGVDHIIVGGTPVENIDIVRHHDNEIVFKLPALNDAPDANRVVGLSLSDGVMETFRAAAFTYIADPVIREVGAYDKLSQRLDQAQHRFLFNAGQTVAIRGEGLSEFTSVLINGQAANNLSLEEAGLLSFTLPSETLGQLDISVSNLPSRNASLYRVANGEYRIYHLYPAQSWQIATQIHSCCSITILRFYRLSGSLKRHTKKLKQQKHKSILVAQTKSRV